MKHNINDMYVSIRPPCPMCGIPALIGSLDHEGNYLLTSCHNCGTIIKMTENWIIIEAWKDGKMKYCKHI